MEEGPWTMNRGTNNLFLDNLLILTGFLFVSFSVFVDTDLNLV